MRQVPAAIPGDSPNPSLALEEGLGFRISRLARKLRSEWVDQLTDLGLAPPQAAVLRALDEGEGAGIRELARRIATDPMNLKRTVDQLEVRGMVASDPNLRPGKKRVIFLTEEGKLVAALLQSKIATQEQWFNTVLSSQNRTLLFEMIERIESSLGESSDPV